MIMNPPGRRLASACLLLAVATFLAACAPTGGPESPMRAVAEPPVSSAPHPASPTPFQVARPTASMAPADMPSFPQQLTSGGCCAYPFWLDDSSTVYYLGRDSAGRSSVMAQGLTAGSPEAVFDRPAWFDADGRFAEYPSGEFTVVSRLSDHVEWRLPTGGRPLKFAPVGSRVAWIVSSNSIANRDQRRSAIWISQIDGDERRRLIDVIGGSLVGWAEDGDALFVSGRLQAQGPAGIWRVALGGVPTLLFEAERVRDVSLSPDRRVLAFYIAFADDVSQDGLWLLDGIRGESTKLEAFGAFRWRGRNRLLVIPLNMNPSPLTLEEYQVGRADPIHEFSFPSLPIADNDWSVSPDGQIVVYRSNLDGNLWWVRLK
jgi:hypothetical protein